MTRPVPRPFSRPAFEPLAPHIQNEIDAQQKAEINQAWRQKEIYDDLARLEPEIITVDDDAWGYFMDFLDQPAAPAPTLAAAFAKPRRFTRIEN